jgi:hypothetical protein
MSNEIKKLFDKFVINDFTYKKERKGFTWTKKEPNKTSRIILPYLDSYPNCIKLQPITVEIYFDEIENIFNNLLKDNIELNQFGKRGSINKIFSNNKYFIENIRAKKIENENDFKLIGINLNIFINEYVLPFINKYNNIIDIFLESEKMEMTDLIDFIEQPLPLRRMIIKKLSNDPNYEAYAKTMIDYFEKDKSFNIDYSPIMESLYEKLRNGK